MRVCSSKYCDTIHNRLRRLCAHACCGRHPELVVQGPCSLWWGGVFSTPSSAYTWVSQAVDGGNADPQMKLVVFALDAAEGIADKAPSVATLMAGSCPAVHAGASPHHAAGACYTLTFPTDAYIDFNAILATSGIDHVAIFTRTSRQSSASDTHYFMSTDLVTDIEPAEQTDPMHYHCNYNQDANGVSVCAQAYRILQAHRDYCPHDASRPTRRSSSGLGRTSAGLPDRAQVQREPPCLSDGRLQRRLDAAAAYTTPEHVVAAPRRTRSSCCRLRHT